MATYKLNKTAKGKKIEYTVTDENGIVISKRMSTREYVACTANGEFYFGRLDLIGKGDHGKTLSRANLILSNPKQAYNESANNFVPSYRVEWKNENPFDKWLEWSTDWAQRQKSKLEQIAYL